MPSVLDLFCGSGGMSFGFESAGYKIIAGVDNDKKAIETFELNHKGSIGICSDITQISYIEDIRSKINEEIDVIIGGPPCQGMSLSGPRRFDDPRNILYQSYIRLVEEIRPKAFVIENVPGLTRLFNGQIRESILERLRTLGYNVEYRILLASDYGVPQKRSRIVFVGLRDGNFDFEIPKNPVVTTEMAISDLPSLENEFGQDFVKYSNLPQNSFQELMRKGSNGIQGHVAAKHSEKVKEIISHVPDGGNYKNLPDEFINTRNFHVAWTRFPSNKPAPTIDTGHRHHFHYLYNRVPTVRECARLQSFPDRFIFLGNKTQQFRQVGNAVPPLMAQSIAEHLLKYLESER